MHRLLVLLIVALGCGLALAALPALPIPFVDRNLTPGMPFTEVRALLDTLVLEPHDYREYRYAAAPGVTTHVGTLHLTLELMVQLELEEKDSLLREIRVIDLTGDGALDSWFRDALASAADSAVYAIDTTGLLYNPIETWSLDRFQWERRQLALMSDNIYYVLRLAPQPGDSVSKPQN